MTSDRGSKLRHQPRMIVIQLNRYVDKVHRMCTSRRWNPPKREAVRRGIILTKACWTPSKLRESLTQPEQILVELIILANIVRCALVPM